MSNPGFEVIYGEQAFPIEQALASPRPFADDSYVTRYGTTLTGEDMHNNPELGTPEVAQAQAEAAKGLCAVEVDYIDDFEAQMAAVLRPQPKPREQNFVVLAGGLSAPKPKLVNASDQRAEVVKTRGLRRVDSDANDMEASVSDPPGNPLSGLSLLAPFTKDTKPQQPTHNLRLIVQRLEGEN